MSNLRSLKKPKKHRKNIGYIIAAIAVVAAIVLGVIALSKKGTYKVPNAEIKTEIVKENE